MESGVYHVQEKVYSLSEIFSVHMHAVCEN